MAETTITEQIVREAPQIEAAKFALMEQAKNLVGTPVSVPAYQVAGMTPDQLQSMEMARQGIGAFAPYIEAGGRSIEAGQGIVGAAAERYAPGAAISYMNPYQAAVTENALAEMRRQADISRQGAAAQAVRAGAFGGTREGVQRAEMERGLADVMGQRILQDYAQNYAQAQQASMMAGQGLQGLGSLAGQLGVQQAALGEAVQRGQLQDIQSLATLGQQQQQQQQAELEAQRMTQLQAQYEPYQRLGFLSDIYKGAPTTQSVLASQTAPSASPFQQVVGTIGGAVSTAAGAKKVGLF